MSKGSQYLQWIVQTIVIQLKSNRLHWISPRSLHKKSYWTFCNVSDLFTYIWGCLVEHVAGPGSDPFHFTYDISLHLCHLDHRRNRWALQAYRTLIKSRYHKPMSCTDLQSVSSSFACYSMWFFQLKNPPQIMAAGGVGTVDQRAKQSTAVRIFAGTLNTSCLTLVHMGANVTNVQNGLAVVVFFRLWP